MGGPLRAAKKCVTSNGVGDAVGVCEGSCVGEDVGVCEGSGEGVTNAAKVPSKIVVSPFLTTNTSPAATSGTVSPCSVDKNSVPSWSSSIIEPMLLSFKNTVSSVCSGKLTWPTCV